MRWYNYLVSLHQKFFFLLLLFLPTQLGLHFWPEWATVLGRRVDYLSPTVYFTDILLITTLFSWFIESAKSIKGLVLCIKGAASKILNTKYLILVLLFVALNILVAQNKPEAIYKWAKVLEFIGLGWYIVRTKPKIQFLIFPLSIGVFYSSVLAIAQFYLQRSVGGLLWWIGERTFSIDTPGIARVNWCSPLTGVCQLLLRPYATFPHPNVLGGYLAVLLPVIIQNTNKQINKLSDKVSVCATIVLGFIALFLTFSRSAWIAAGIGISSVCYIFWKKQKIFLPLLLTTFIFLLLTVMFRPNLSDESVVVREQLNSAAAQMWQTSPLLGAGLGNFLVELPRFLPSRQVYFLQPVHNIYLLILAETGVVGMALFGLLLLRSIKGLAASIKGSGKRNSLILHTTYVPLVILLLLGLVDHYPITLQQGQILLTLFLVLQ